MRLHLVEQGGEAIEMLVAVVQVVNDADVGEIQFADDRELVLRFAEPAAVVVERDAAADLGRGGGDASDPRRFRLHAITLLLFRSGRPATSRDPQLRLDVVPLQHIQDQSRFVAQVGGEPPSGQLDAVPLDRLHLGVERGDVVGTVIVRIPA